MCGPRVPALEAFVRKRPKPFTIVVVHGPGNQRQVWRKHAVPVVRARLAPSGLANGKDVVESGLSAVNGGLGLAALHSRRRDAGPE